MKSLRFAMLGLVDENAHPWSWSAIFNGWDIEAMKQCPAPPIPIYLAANSDKGVIEGAKVTHIWTDEPEETPKIAAAALIPNLLEHPEDAIGLVDAVLIPTDRGWEHVERARPFVEAGIPVFVDKPLCDNEADLQTFSRWVEEGKPILSNSALRYAREFAPFRDSTEFLGELRWGSITTPKSWERYGIHALEGIYPIFGPGFVSARNIGQKGRDIVFFRHQSGADCVVSAIDDLYGGLGALQLCGTKSFAHAKIGDNYHAFRAQLEAFTRFVQTGQRDFPFSQTIELIKMVIAGIRSREEGGREVFLSEILER